MPQRYGSVIGVKEEKIAYYKELHAAAWPDVLKTIRACNIRNFSIYLRQLPDGQHYLFSYFEYVGEDFAADMAKMGEDPMTRQWWAETDPCQTPLPDVGPDGWWADMEEVFHCD